MSRYTYASGREQRRAVDGILPTNREVIMRPPARSRLRQPQQGPAQPKLPSPHQAVAPSEASLLHMSLPLDGNLSRHRNRKKSARRSNWSVVRRIGLWTSLVTALLVVTIGGFLFAKGYFKLHKVFKGTSTAVALAAHVDPNLLKGEGDGRVNILLLGRGGDGHDGADLTDTMLLASIDPVNKKAALVSIPRDLWVNDGGSSTKINAVFAFAKQKALLKSKDTRAADAAGAVAAEQMVSTITGVPIHYYGLIDFEAFEQAVNTVGGVDISITPQTAVTEKLWDESTHKNYYLNVTPGMQHFDGQKALFFSRSRHTSARGDFDRSERQRVFLEALSQKITTASTFTNPLKVSQLMDAFGNHVATDLSLNDAMRLMSLGKAIGGNFDSIDLADPAAPLIKTAMIGNQSVVVPTAGLGDYSGIQALLHSRLPDGYIMKEAAPLTVLNGSTKPTLATKKAEELRSYGYNVGTVADAPTHTYAHTVVVDLSHGKDPYTKNYLEKRYGVQAVTSLPDMSIQAGNASFVIIIGNDETINR